MKEVFRVAYDILIKESRGFIVNKPSMCWAVNSALIFLEINEIFNYEEAMILLNEHKPLITYDNFYWFGWSQLDMEKRIYILKKIHDAL